MTKNTPLFCILVVFLILSCTTDQTLDRKNIKNRIIQLQEKSRQNTADSTLFYLKKAETLIQSALPVSDSLNLENNYLIGAYYSKLGKIDSASAYHYKAIERIKDSIKTKREYTYLYNAWITHKQLQEYGECIAISKRFESLITEKDYTNKLRLYYLYLQTYIATQQFEKALKYADLRIKMYTDNNDVENVTIATITRTEIQYLYQNDKKGAYQTLDVLLSKKDSLDNDQKRHLYIQYGYYLHLDQKFDKARDYYHKGLFAIKQLDKTPFYTKEYARIYANLGEVYLDLKKYDSAKIYLDKALQEDILNSSEITRSDILSYKLRYAQEINASYEETQKYLDTITKYQNARYEEKYTKDLKSLESSYQEREKLQAQKQQAEIEKLKVRAQLLLVAIISLILIGLGVYFYKKRQRTFDTMSLQMQQRLLRSQMNPHFTFNTLYAIQNTIKKDPQGAVDYLLKFSRLLRLILENSTNNYVLLEKELESLRKYIDLQLLRFPNTFEYEIKLHNLEEDDFIFIPPMLIQPYIENCIEHAFKGIDYKGKITLTLSEKKGFLECRIEDNGVGLQKSKNTYKASVSKDLIKEFIEKATKQKITDLNKKDLDASTSGVITTFLIPYKVTEHD